MSPPVIKVSVLTTPPSLKLKLLPKPVVQVKATSRFPASVSVLSPILLDRTGGNYTFSLDLNELIESLPPGGVTSVFGRTGDVTAQSGDYTFAQISSTSTTLSGYGILDAQPLDADLTAISGLVTATYGRSLLTLANATALAAEVDSFFLTPAEGNAVYQPLDSDLTALAANSTNGLWARTGAGTGSARTITGTANQITVTNGDGASGNPTLSIPSNAALPGAPTTTTAAVDDNSTKIATTAMVIGQAAAATPLGNAATAVVGTSTRFARADHVHPGREVLTANRTYYVRTDGSDSNNGLANTSGGAFLTIQKAVDVIAATLDIAGYIVTVQVADGTYTGAVTLKNVVGFSAAGDLVIRGNNTTPANVVISVTGNTCFTANGISSVWDILDLKMQTTTSGNCLLALAGAKMRWGNTDFGACIGNHIQAFGPGSTLTSLSNYAITGSASGHFQAYYGGVIITPSRTITITGTLSISIFADMRVLGSGQLFSLTFAGTYTVTGTRYRSQENSVCFVNGAGATYFPGDVAGSTSTGGLYV